MSVSINQHESGALLCARFLKQFLRNLLQTKYDWDVNSADSFKNHVHLNWNDEFWNLELFVGQVQRNI